MNTSKSKIPTQIILILILVLSTVVVDQLSSFYDAQWEIAEFSFDDPFYLGFSMFWAAIVIWLSIHIIKRKKHIPNTLLILTIIVGLFFVFDFMDSEYNSVSLISFQFLEIIMWLLAYVISINSSGKEWFVE